ncbi:hypothetical protein [Actinoallomurus liliacearum]
MAVRSARTVPAVQTSSWRKAFLAALTAALASTGGIARSIACG